MKYNFDQRIDRTDFNSTKWEGYPGEFPGLDTTGAIPMWIADMDFLSPPEVIEALTKRAEHGIYGYNSRLGEKKFIRAIVQWIAKRYHWQVDESVVVTSPGVVPAMSFAVRAVTKPGDGIITFSPVYYPITSSIQNNERVNKIVPLQEKDGYYTIDFEKLEEAARDPRTTMLMLCSPHNPVGRVWTEEELKRIVEICGRYDVTIFSDEIHADLVFGCVHHPVGAVAEGTGVKTICAYAAGKTFNLACLNTAAVVIPDADVREKFVHQLACTGLATPPGAFGAVGSEAAYLYGEPYLEELLVYLQGNIDYAYDYIRENLPGVRMRKPEGTYLTWLDFRGLGLSTEETDRFVLEKAKVILDPGWWFGEEGACFMRMNVACPRSLLNEGLERLKHARETL